MARSVTLMVLSPCRQRHERIKIAYISAALPTPTIFDGFTFYFCDPWHSQEGLQ